MKTRISLFAAAILLSCCATLAVALHGSRRQAALLEDRAREQQLVIDSLLGRRMTVVDVQMHVTDRSTSKIYGRYNKGTISVETERRYILEIDSTNFKIR